MSKLDDTLKIVNYQKTIVIWQNTIGIFFMSKKHKKNSLSFFQNNKRFFEIYNF